MVVVGSGAMAVQMSPDLGVELLINAVSTVLALGILIYIFGSVSGAHFNPVVSISEWAQKRLSLSEAIALIAAQCAGGIAGAMIANLMYKHPAYFPSHHIRTGTAIWLGEVIATAGLLFLIQVLTGSKAHLAPVVIAGWIGSAYFFTSSTSFANPAVTLARSVSDTFSGIALESVGACVVAQILGAILGTAIGNYFKSAEKRESE